MEPTVEFRRLGRTELSRVVEIDRRERIDVLYDQHGTQLVARHGDWSAPAWDSEGHGEHSVEAQMHALEHHVDSGGTRSVRSRPDGWSASVSSCHTFGPEPRSWHSST